MRKLYRSTYDKKLAGVCGGLADYFGIDATLVRLLWIVASLIFGSGILLYILAAIIIPADPDSEWRG
ncbi:PspC domain-containing protein [Listeria grayi]|uniref:PspC domain protein n=1 Tax=Listeria grayi DSM 20601 TaxID=525367 RepID=D7UW85_LISGR|nr:PspC domain-containing protein [Listeria grayi]EFI84813.1 PspC domain protein [Listeria grayi DSM 20601]MBC1922566.1 PspC domain-containing protein [Listeria grayi]